MSTGQSTSGCSKQLCRRMCRVKSLEESLKHPSSFSVAELQAAIAKMRTTCRKAKAMSTGQSNTTAPEDMTLAEHAEAWTREAGETVPAYPSAEWTAMYARWAEFAFAAVGK